MTITQVNSSSILCSITGRSATQHTDSSPGGYMGILEREFAVSSPHVQLRKSGLNFPPKMEFIVVLFREMMMMTVTLIVTFNKHGETF